MTTIAAVPELEHQARRVTDGDRPGVLDGLTISRASLVTGMFGLEGKRSAGGGGGGGHVKIATTIKGWWGGGGGGRKGEIIELTLMT